MENKKILIYVKYIVLLCYLLVLAGIIVFWIWNYFSGRIMHVSSYIYWMIFLGWVALIYTFKFGSNINLKIAFFLFIAGAINIIVSLDSIGENLMKISLLGWILGTGQAIFDNRKTS